MSALTWHVPLTHTPLALVICRPQSSQQDVQALVDYVYDKEGADIDYIIPFAAIPEGGRVRELSTDNSRNSRHACSFGWR